MGAAGQGRRDQDGGRHLNRAARVVPNVPSFAVDEGFLYSLPESLLEQVEVGSIVRVPLSGRRVRGWVVGFEEPEGKNLKEILGVSSPTPVFSHQLLKTLRWAAEHYGAPLSVLLTRASPPNLPKGRSSAGLEDVNVGAHDHELGDIARSLAKGARMPTQVLVGKWRDLAWITALGPVLGAGISAMVLAASAAEASEIGDAARAQFGSRVLVVAGGDDSEVTTAWEQAQVPGVLLVGTPRVALWKVAGLALTVVVEEARRAMKERQTPTLHVREVVRYRSLMEGTGSVFLGPTPSVELLASGAQSTMLAGRPWPLIEVVHRRRGEGTAGLLEEQTTAALRGAAKRGKTSFVLSTHSMLEGYRKEIQGRIGTTDAPLVQVGTESDLAGMKPVALAVAPYPEAIVQGWGYRGSEEVLRVLARLANKVGPGQGNRLLVQTDEPESPLIVALRRGEPLPYLERVLVERARAGLPPSVAMLALEVREKIPEDVEDVLNGLAVDQVHGPLDIEDGKRWLLQGDLRTARRKLRPVVGRWREAGSVVRIDADPIDL